MKNLIPLLAAFIIIACDNNSSNYKISEQTPSIEKGANVVDAGEYFLNPAKYENQEVYLYIRQVQAPKKNSNEKDRVFSFDKKLSLNHLGFYPSKKILKKWLDAGLDEEGSYTITFRSKTTDASNGNKMFYRTEFDRFVVNSEDGFLHYERPSSITLVNGLPTERAAEPLAKLERDFKNIKLYPEKYKNRRVHTSFRLFERDIKTYNDDYWIVDENPIKILLPKSEFRKNNKQFPYISDAIMTGTLKPEDGEYTLLADTFYLN